MTLHPSMTRANRTLAATLALFSVLLLPKAQAGENNYASAEQIKAWANERLTDAQKVQADPTFKALSNEDLGVLKDYAINGDAGIPVSLNADPFTSGIDGKILYNSIQFGDRFKFLKTGANLKVAIVEMGRRGLESLLAELVLSDSKAGQGSYFHVRNVATLQLTNLFYNKGGVDENGSLASAILNAAQTSREYGTLYIIARQMKSIKTPYASQILEAIQKNITLKPVTEGSGSTYTDWTDAIRKAVDESIEY